jgi:hypothetical protein
MPREVRARRLGGPFDIPVVYGDGRRAIIAIEKGTPGERVFTDAAGRAPL